MDVEDSVEGPLSDQLIVPVYPFTGVTVMVAVPLPPALTAMAAGVAAIVKLGPTLTVTVFVEGA